MVVDLTSIQEVSGFKPLTLEGQSPNWHIALLGYSLNGQEQERKIRLDFSKSDGTGHGVVLDHFDDNSLEEALKAAIPEIHNISFD